MKEVIAAVLAVGAIAGAGGAELLKEAFCLLRKETARKLSEPQPNLESFTQKMTGGHNARE